MVRRFLLGAIALLSTCSSPAIAQTVPLYSDRNGNSQGAIGVVQMGGNGLATAQVSVGASPTLLAAARAGRIRVTVSVGAANACYIGGAAVSASTGFALQPVAGAALTLDFAGPLYAACASTTTISVAEAF